MLVIPVPVLEGNSPRATSPFKFRPVLYCCDAVPKIPGLPFPEMLFVT